MTTQPMSKDEASKAISEAIDVTPQMIIVAKRFITQNFTSTTSQLLDMFLTDREATIPRAITFSYDFDPRPELLRTASGISWKLAAIESIWGLIHSGHLLPLGNNMTQWRPIISYKSDRFCSGIEIPIEPIDYPNSIRLVPSTHLREPRLLTDGDLYIDMIGSANMSREVAITLHEASICLRYALYLAALALLGKAMESAWIEMGESLLTTLQKTDQEQADKIHEILTSPREGLQKKISKTMELYGKPEIKPIRKACGIEGADLNAIAQYSDCVRDSRNSLHYGVTSSLPNNYEKVATLMLGSVPFLRILYRIKAAADERSGV